MPSVMALRPATRRAVFAALVALLAFLSMYVAWKAMFPRRTERLAVGTACAYTRRVQESGKWVCPKGTVDTGRSWEDKDGDGEKQCLVGCAVSPHCQYTQRTQQGKNKEWKCPEGYVDSGLDWGVAYGEGWSNIPSRYPRKVANNKALAFVGWRRPMPL